MEDVTGLDEWIADLAKAQTSALLEVRKVVSKGALNIKTSAIRRISGHPHSPAYPRSIGYNTYQLSEAVRAEIGPDKDKRQGALGNILEYGTVNNPPIPHLGPALTEESPRFERAMGDLGETLLAD